MNTGRAKSARPHLTGIVGANLRGFGQSTLTGSTTDRDDGDLSLTAAVWQGRQTVDLRLYFVLILDNGLDVQ